MYTVGLKKFKSNDKCKVNATLHVKVNSKMKTVRGTSSSADF